MADSRAARFIEQLQAALDAPRGTAIALLGGPGMGKTWLAARCLPGLRSRSISIPGATPLPEFLARLPQPPTLSAWAQRTLASAGADGAATAAAVAAVLKRLAPVVLHVDDLHEAGPALTDVISRLAAIMPTVRGTLLLVASRRQPAGNFTASWIEPLGAEETGELLRQELGTSAPDAALAWIQGRAAGNPLFTLEYGRQLTRAGHLWSDGRQWHWRSPQADLWPVRVGAIVERVAAEAKTLGDDASAALEARAILGAGALAETVWAEVAGLDALRLRDAVQLLGEQGSFRGGDFSHALIQEQVLAGLTAEKRRVFARRAVTASTDDPLFASRFVADAGLPPAQALRLLLSAANLAQDRHHAATLRAKASVLAEGRERITLALEAARVLVQTDLPAALQLLTTTIEIAPADLELFMATASALAGAGRLDEAIALADEFRERGGAAADALALEFMSNHLAGAHAQALGLWQSHAGLRNRADASLLRAAAASALATGEVGLADELLHAGTEPGAADPEERAALLSLRALAVYHQGDSATALTLIGEAIGILQELGSWRAMSSAKLNQAAFFRQLSRFREMDEALAECLRLRSDGSDPRAFAFAQAALAELRIEQARFDEAETLLTGALETLELLGPSRFLTNTLAIASALYAARQDSLLAVSYGERALRTARESGSPRVIREIAFDTALAHAHYGDATTALALAEEMAGLAEAAGESPSDECRTAWARGLALGAAGDQPAAAAALREARAAALAAGLQLEAGKITIELARLEGDPEAAKEAAGWFEARGLGLGALLFARAFPQKHAGAHDTSASESFPGQILEVLGSMRLGPADAPATVSGERRRHLLALLLTGRLSGMPVSSDLALIDALYPGTGEEAALLSLRQLVHQVRRRHGSAVIVRTAGGYELGSGVAADIEVFASGGAPPGWLERWRGPPFADVPGLQAAPLVDRLIAVAIPLLAGSLDGQADLVLRVARWAQEAAPFERSLVALEVAALLRSGPGAEAAARAALEAARPRFLDVGEQLPAGALELAAEVSLAQPRRVA